MKKKYILLIYLFCMLLFPNLSVKAMKPYEFESRKECEHIELAIANKEGNLEHVECYETYDEARSVMNKTSNDDLVIIEDGMIIDAKFAVIDYDVDFKNASTKYIRIYDSKASKNSINYIRTAGGMGDDALLLDYDYKTKRVKIKVAGIVGWIDKYDNKAKLYEIVPYTWIKSPQYYVVTNDTITHYFPGNVYGEKGTSSYTIDIKPSMLEPGTYYSYDGHYFYTSFRKMITDNKRGNHDRAVNNLEPYYNYYQYLSFRTKTNYTMDNINDYINKRTNNESKLYNTGEYFINTQNSFGVNAVLMLSIGINESGWGKSNIAKTKNNLFGLNAVDATPGESSDYFIDVYECIKTYGYSWLSYWYLQPGDSHFRGANLGNKIEGLNIKYASDPFWAEKAAHYYYEIDSNFDFQDRDTYKLAVLNDNYLNTVYAKKKVNGEIIGNYYQYKVKDSVVVVLDEIKDENGNLWYKIQNDPNLDENLNYIGDSKSNPRVDYNWNGYVYVEAKYFNIIYNGSNEYSVKDDTNQEKNVKEEVKEEPKVEVADLFKNSNYSYKDNIVSKIDIKTDVNKIKDEFTKLGLTSIEITDGDGNKKTNGYIGTGDKITVSTKDKTEVIRVLIYGDINGDGLIDKTDCVAILRQIYGYKKYGNLRTEASDINKDGKVDKVDASQVLRHYYGYANIKQ